jgi:hypothetical protein
MVEPTATEPAVAAIWVRMPGWPVVVFAAVFVLGGAVVGVVGGRAELDIGGAANVDAERDWAGAGW